MNPTKGVPPIITRRLDKNRDPNQCAWFLQCTDQARWTVNHPTLGDVPVCDHHMEWLKEDSESV